MASIIADLSDDIKKMKSLKEEIQQVKKELGSINVKVELDIKRDMEARLKALTGQYDALVQKVAQAEAKIAESTARINKSAETIIKAQEQMTKAASGQGVANAQGTSGGNSAATNAQTASVQAQAKAYDELANEIDAVMGTRAQNIKRMVEEQNAIRIINEELKRMQKLNQSGVYSASETRRIEQLNASLMQHKTALSELRQSLNNSFKLDSAAATSMNALSQSLARMRMTYRELTEEERNSPFGQELLASIQQADAKIKQLDASIGNHQRNVGNYASGWNGLNMSIQQIGRELPSLAMGWNTFFLAISNNLPILTDEIKRAKDEYNRLKEAGQQATPVWKQVVSSLLSWQTALTVGITLLTMYGSEIIDWVSGLFKAQKQLDLGKESVKAFNDAMLKGGKSAQQEVTTLNLLYDATQNLSRGMNERLAAVEKLQQQYPSYFANFSKEDILAGKAADSYVRLAQSITASAKAQAARNSIVEQQSKVLENEQKINEAYSRLQEAENKLQEIREFYKKQEEEGFGSATSKLNTENAIIQAETNIKSIEKEIAGYRSAIYQANKISKDLEKNINIEDLIFDSGGTEESKAKAVDNLKDYLDELTKLREDNVDRQVELMEDGTEKQIAEIKLRYKRMRDEVRSLEQELTKSQGGKLTKDQEATFSMAYTTIDMREWKDISKTGNTEDRIRKEKEAMNRYLQEYGTFQQKRLAITEEYQQKISKAETEGEKLLLQKQMEEALSGIDMDELKESINWELVFSDLGNVSKKSLQQIKKQLGDFKESAEYKDMGMEQKKVVDEALNNIQSAIIDKGGLLGDLPTQLEELRKAQEDLTQAQEEYNKALAEGTDEQKEAAQKKLNKSQQGVQKAQLNVERSTKTATDNLLTLADAITQLGGNSEMTLSEIGRLAGGIADTFAEAGSKIGGIIGAIFTLLDQIGKQGLDGFLGNVFSSVGSALYGVFDTLLGWGGFDFGGESDPTLERDIERLTTANQELEKAINNLSDKMDESSLAEALDIYEVQKENIQKMMANTWDMMYRSVGASSDGFLGIGGHHSSGYKIDNGMSAQDWEAISKVIGRQINGAGEFFMLSSEEMWKVANEATTEYAKLKELADDGYKDAAQFMDEYIGYWQELENLENEYREKLTSVSFDTIRNDFRNALLGMEDDAEAFSENFEKMMKDAVLESMMTEKYDKRLKDWYKLFSGYMEGGYLGEGEQDDLRDEWQGIVNDALEEWKHWQKIMGWDTESSANQQQSASSGGYETMTQDQASELNGRFTALNESSLRQEAIQQGISDIAEDMRNIIAQSYIELQQISENTGDSAKYLKDIKADISIVKQNTSRI